ncbi:unnamed protein product [Mortierella alpina]
MVGSTAHSVFATPELVLLVAEHLDLCDLARCYGVCKEWSRQFERILWSNVCLQQRRCNSLKTAPDSPMKAALIRNLPLIRTLKILCVNNPLLQFLTHGSADDPSSCCSNLKRFEIEDISCDHLDLASQHLTTLLDLNHHLTTLEVPFELLDNNAALASLSKLNTLERLSVSSLKDYESEQVLLFLKACLPLPNLTHLYFDFDLLWGDLNRDIRDLKAIIRKAVKARFSRNPRATKITALRLPSKYGDLNNPLPLLLLESNLLDLESCEIPWFDVDENPEKIEQVVRRHCPRLKHLICPSFSGYDQDGLGVGSFIAGCTGLQSFVSRHFVDHEPESESEPRHIISTLAAQHSDTLEILELTECDQATSADLQAILSRCKRLKRFWVMNSYPGDVDIGIKSADILREEWVCTELTELGLTLNRFLGVELVLAHTEAVEEDLVELEYWWLIMTGKSVYSQIGRLAKLETLALDIDKSEDTKAIQGAYAWDLTLSRGWLRELAGLKSLKTLKLQADFWSMMGQAEVEFIHEHWPSLSEEETLSDMRHSPMKDALIRNLPHIRTVKCFVANAALLQVLTNGSSTDSSQPCTQLMRLEIKKLDYELADITSRYLATLLHLNQCLTQLEFPIEFLNTEAVSASLSKLENLQRLTVSSTCRCEGKQAIVLLRSCLRLPNLTQLFIKLDMWWPGNDQGILLKAVIEEASVARFSRDRNATRIKSLQLPSNRNGGNNPLPLLLLKSKLLDLESCEISWFDPRTDPDEPTEVVREHHPNLKHLTCPSFKDNEEDGYGVSAFIKGCAGLRSFNSDRFIDQDHEGEARCFISTLAAHRSNTLEDFELTECYQLFSHDQQAILSRCKQLKRFWVMSSTPYDSNIGIISTDVLREKWVCMELTKLGLTLNRFSKADRMMAELRLGEGQVVEPEDSDAAAKSVYMQIGRLAKLEMLVLNVDGTSNSAALLGDYAWDLTLSRGWLYEMAGLKSVKTLILRADFWSRMVQSEVEFIHEHWLLLKEIHLCGKGLLLSPRSPWRWLLANRPQLSLLHEA